MRLFRFLIFMGLCVGVGAAQSTVPTAKCDFYGARAAGGRALLPTEGVDDEVEGGTVTYP
jgi:hypothetical protein